MRAALLTVLAAMLAFGLVYVGYGAGKRRGAFEERVRRVSQAGERYTPMTFPIRCTGYWPFTARPDEQRMEGGVLDRKGHPLHTLEDYRAGKADYVSVSGDYTIFPYGQRITIDQWPDVIFRIVDTGSHFHGAGKVYRIPGREPFDICVASSQTPINPESIATIVPGDHWDHPGAVVAMDRIGQAPTAVA